MYEQSPNQSAPRSDKGLHAISNRLDKNLNRMNELSLAIFDKVANIYSSNSKGESDGGTDKVSPNDAISEINHKLYTFEEYNDRLERILSNLQEII